MPLNKETKPNRWQNIWLVGKTGFFNLGKATSLEQKLWIQISFTPLKNWSCVLPVMEGLGKYVHNKLNLKNLNFHRLLNGWEKSKQSHKSIIFQNYNSCLQVYEFTQPLQHEQDETQCQFLSGVQKVWIQFPFFKTGCHTKS